MHEKSLLTVKEKILLHLADYPADKYVQEGQEDTIYGVLPHALSQKGIADGIGIRWNHVPRSIKVLLNEGLILRFSASVEGHMRRVNVYFLSPKGIEEAVYASEKINEVMINIRKGEDTEEVSASNLSTMLDDKISPLMLIVLSNDAKDVLQMEALEARSMEEKAVSPSVHMLGEAPSIENFYNREKELSDISDILSDRKVLVVSGITGIGKSALVAKVVEEYKERYSTMWFNITDWDTPKILLNRIGEFFALSGKRDIKRVLSRSKFSMNEVLSMTARNLEESPCLFIFDNYDKCGEELTEFFKMFFERLVDKELKMVIISRTIPEFYDRREVNIRNTVGEIKLSGLTYESTVCLLTEKGIPEKNIDELYKLTGGHPLSLELIRNPEDIKKPSDLYRFLQDELLSQLGDDEKKLLAYASILTYPIEIDALTHVDPPIEALDKLIDLNLIQDLPSGMIYLHNLLKEVMYSRLSSDEVEEYSRIAADYFLSQDNVEDTLKGIRYLISGEFFDDACEAFTDVGTEALNKGFIAELKDVLTDIEGNIPTDQHYKIYALEGDLHFQEGDYETAKEYYKRSLKSTSESNYKARCHAYMQLGLIYLGEGDVDMSNNNLQIALDMANITGEKDLLALVNGAISRLFIHQGEHGRAKDVLEIALAYAQEGEHKVEYYDLLCDMGRIYNDIGDTDNALELADKSRQFFEETNEVFKLGRVYNLMGVSYFIKDDHEEALNHWNLAVENARKSGALKVLGYGLLNSVSVLTRLDRFDEGFERLGEAENIFEIEKDKGALSYLYQAYGILYIEKQEYDKAEDYMLRSLELAEETGAPFRVAERYFLLGVLFKKMENYDRSKEYLNNALRIYKSRGKGHLIPSILNELKEIKELAKAKS